MTAVIRALNSIGKKCFIDYYEDFRNCSDINALAQRLFANNKNATSFLAQMTRIHYAQWIFENQKEKEALNIIIKSDRLDQITKNKARNYFKSL